MGNKQILLAEDDESSSLVIQEHFLKNSCSADYLTKPFMIEGLIARMNAIIRRGHKGLRIKTHTPSLGKCFFGCESRSLIIKGGQINARQRKIYCYICFTINVEKYWTGKLLFLVFGEPIFITMEEVWVVIFPN